MRRAPKVAVVQDMSGFGRCSMTVALPVLAAMGGQCCPVLTAYLSAHTGFPPGGGAVFHDMSGQIPGVTEHWGELGVALDAVYSGFLGSAGQVDHLLALITRFRREGCLVLVDPVMGDHGRAYRTCTPDLRAGMARLCAQADVITPNLTEAAMLLGEGYREHPEPTLVRSWLERLSRPGGRSVVITGVSAARGEIGAACIDGRSGKISFAMARQEKGSFPGTGDLFASVLLGALLRGESLERASILAVGFVQRAVRRTLDLGTPALEGVQFEGLLGELTK